jgi:hypothetical protein
MRRPPQIKKPRKPPTTEELAEVARRYADVYVADPKWQEIKQTYSIPELIDIVRAAEKTSKAKRGKGRPEIPNKGAILDAAATAKVQEGTYTQIAARWKLKPKQLTDLVGNNRTYFKRKVKEVRAKYYE